MKKVKIECKECEKYTVSCSVLEGFECCKCCGILGCEYDICPPEEKLYKDTARTVHEHKTLYSLSSEAFEIEKAKDAFLEGRFYTSGNYYEDACRAENKLEKLKEKIKQDSNLRLEVKTKCLEKIKYALKSCKDLYYYLKADLSKDKGNLKKTTFYYIKKHLNRMSIKSISNNNFLSREEKKILLLKKGVKNPLPLIH